MIWRGRAEKNETETKQAGSGVLSQKRGVLQHHVYMPLRNSFPQICVVSKAKIADKRWPHKST
jgi:hypothetical protein